MRVDLPPRPFLGAILWRATWLWVGFHMVAAMGLAGLSLPPEAALRQNALGALWIWGFTALTVHLLGLRRGETLILANLGISAVRSGAVVVAWCAALEACLRLVAEALA